VKPLLLISVVCLAVGVGLVFGYCNGSTGMALGDSLAAASIHIDITTKGIPFRSPLWEHFCFSSLGFSRSSAGGGEGWLNRLRDAVAKHFTSSGLPAYSACLLMPVVEDAGAGFRYLSHHASQRS
jgi:hypothetical protein